MDVPCQFLVVSVVDTEPSTWLKYIYVVKDTTVSVCQASASKIPWDLLSCTVAILFVVSTKATAPADLIF